jgi:hypothetical protein
MAKKKEGPLLLELASLLPWWLDIGLGAGGFLLCRWARSATMALDPTNLNRMMMRGVIQMGATVGIFIVPASFAVGAVISLANRRKQKRVAAHATGSLASPSTLSMSLSSSVVPACPTCSKQMIQRTARKGPNAGQSFWGCPSYPTCKGTRQIS